MNTLCDKDFWFVGGRMPTKRYLVNFYFTINSGDHIFVRKFQKIWKIVNKKVVKKLKSRRLDREHYDFRDRHSMRSF